jgi:hypothetical protein
MLQKSPGFKQNYYGFCLRIFANENYLPLTSGSSSFKKDLIRVTREQGER